MRWCLVVPVKEREGRGGIYDLRHVLPGLGGSSAVGSGPRAPHYFAEPKTPWIHIELQPIQMSHSRCSHGTQSAS